MKRKSGFFLKRMNFHWVLRTEKIPDGPMVPCPGKKVPRFAGPKKAVTPLFPRRPSAASARVSLCPRVSLRKQRGENREGFSRPFLSSAPTFLAGQQGNGSERPTKLEMILNLTLCWLQFPLDRIACPAIIPTVRLASRFGST